MNDEIRWSEIFNREDFSDFAVSNEWRNGTLIMPDRARWDHGTCIRMKLLKTRKISVPNVIRDLSRLFAPGLRRGKEIIWCQQRAGEIIEERPIEDPFKITARPENTVRFDFVVEHGDRHLPVHGVISFDDNTSHADSLIRIGFSYREIMRTRDCFRSKDEAFAGIGVSGWLDLGDGWQPYLSTTKDAFDDQPLYDALMEHVFNNIRDLLLRAEQQAVDFELDNLAIGLEIALERTMKMKVKVARAKSGGGSGGDGPGTGDKSDKTKPENETDATASAHIALWRQPDDHMMGALARAGSDPKGIYVDINQDHAFVREAMKQKPINAAALNLMIVSEIAVLFVEDDKLAKKAFKKAIVDELDKRDGPEKVRMLTRYMIENVPDKHQVAAE
jgi:hypothetical protein